MPYKDFSKRRQKRLAELGLRPTVCPLCSREVQTVYDHDHGTGLFRGYICANCNLALGHVRDNIPLLYKLVEYLSMTKEALREGDNPETSGVKFDRHKIRYDLLPPEGVEAVSDILTEGAKKYGARNWEGGMDWSRPFGAALRHLFAWWSGENKDPDSGRSHLWHAATNLFFLITYEKRGIGKDDRQKTVS